MLQIYRGSRVEVLASLLAAQLHRWRPASVLAPQTVLVGHPGMQRWLDGYLAELVLPGLPRIAANLQYLLPGEWLDGLARAVLGRASMALVPYRRTALRWQLYALLENFEPPEVAAYLRGQDGDRRRFQLAERLAGLYTQYLVYRRDWLARWEAGRADFDLGDHWQGELWRRVVRAIGHGHRGQRMSELLARLPQLPPDPDQPALHVFGHSHLPPDVLMTLRQLARSREVIIYFPDPCRELWEDLRTDRQRFLEATDDPFVDLGQPLLAALGRLGQHHALLLNGLGAADDHRDQDDLQLSARGERPLLACVQDSIRTLQSDWPAAPAEQLRADVSLRVHCCHTRLRELEVLHDALLDLLARNADLQPRQIVVMAPDMAAYLPLIPAVFGPAGRAGGRLPYHLADVSLGRSHPLLTAFAQLLDLPGQRISRSQVLSLLGLPAVMRRLGLDEAQLQALQRWLLRSRVAWGLDGPMKSDFGAASVGDNSFAFGFDRMAAGYLLGREGADQLLDGILPADPVQGPDAQGLAALWSLLELLRQWRAESRRRRPLSAWVETLLGWISALFQADWQDPEEQSALAALERAVAALRGESEQADLDPEVDWGVVQEAVLQALDAVPERQAFLVGGISFCGLVPQRSIPFQVVAVLGLNDGEFPRSGAASGLDLMQIPKHRRLGDRAARSEDRYLFLEALMSARSALHLSWVGQGVQDGKARNPALPLAELLRQLDQVHGCSTAAEDSARPWLLRHALQPFDARYFDPAGSDPRWFSYSTEFAAASGDAHSRPWQFLDPDLPTPEVAEDGRVELSTLCAFYAHPAQWWCEQALGLDRSSLDEGTDSGDREPLTRDRGQRDDTPVQLLWEALHAGREQIPVAPPEHLRRSGQLAAGWMGDRAWEELRQQAEVLLQGVRRRGGLGAGPPVPAPQAIDLTLGQRRLVGQLDHVYLVDGAWQLLRVVNSQRADFGKLLPLYMQWAALRLAFPDRPLSVRLLRLDKKNGPLVSDPWVERFPQDGASLRAGLEGLLADYLQAGSTAASYFPASSHAAAKAAIDHKDMLSEAGAAWQSRFGASEADYQPGYNRLLGGERHFLDAHTVTGRSFLARVDRYLQWLGLVQEGRA